MGLITVLGWVGPSSTQSELAKKLNKHLKLKHRKIVFVAPKTPAEQVPRTNQVFTDDDSDNDSDKTTMSDEQAANADDNPLLTQPRTQAEGIFVIQLFTIYTFLLHTSLCLACA